MEIGIRYQVLTLVYQLIGKKRVINYNTPQTIY